MPRVKKYSSKSEFIREYLSEHPEATDDQIIRAGNKAHQSITKFAIGYVRYSRPSLDKVKTASPQLFAHEADEVRLDMAATFPDSTLQFSESNPYSDLGTTKIWRGLKKETEMVKAFCEKHGGLHKVKAIIENMGSYDQLRRIFK